MFLKSILIYYTTASTAISAGSMVVTHAIAGSVVSSGAVLATTSTVVTIGTRLITTSATVFVAPVLLPVAIGGAILGGLFSLWD